MTDTPEPRPQIFDVTYISGSNEQGDVYATDTVKGFLGITPDFVALTDAEGRLVYYRPSHLVTKAVATGEVPETPSGSVN